MQLYDIMYGTFISGRSFVFRFLPSHGTDHTHYQEQIEEYKHKHSTDDATNYWTNEVWAASSVSVTS